MKAECQHVNQWHQVKNTTSSKCSSQCYINPLKTISIFFAPVSYCCHKRICRCSVTSKANVMVDLMMLVTWSAMWPLGRCWDHRHEVELGIAWAEVVLKVSFSSLGWSHCQFLCSSFVYVIISGHFLQFGHHPGCIVLLEIWCSCKHQCLSILIVWNHCWTKQFPGIW